MLLQLYPTTMKWFLSLQMTLLLALTSAQEYKSCGAGKECVPIFLCQGGMVVKNGAHLIDIRGSSTKTQCQREKDATEKSVEITIRKRRAEDEDEDSLCDFLDVCCISANKALTPISSEKYVNCGYSNPAGIGLVDKTATNQAKLGEFPWMTLILRKLKADEFEFVCSGTIIAPTVILTAAHCVTKCQAENFLVRTVQSPEIMLVDRFTNADWNNEMTHQQLAVHKIIAHEQFDQDTFINDIALLVVQGPGFKWQDTVQPICLPTAKTFFDISRCLQLDWSADTSDLHAAAVMKRDAALVPNNVCQQRFRDTRLGKYFELHDSFLCAEGENPETNYDVCERKRGAPLVCPITGNNNRYYLIGIGAWGIGCGQGNLTDVYASILDTRDWIVKTLDSYVNTIRVDTRHSFIIKT